MPGVVESAVIGLPHPDFGEAVVAVVTLEPGVTFVESDVINALQKRLAAFKRPKRVLFVPELPRNAMGKVQKALLRREHENLFAS
jgi:malonyl-CoA/methylmalonyl-CoA synthetase